MKIFKFRVIFFVACSFSANVLAGDLADGQLPAIGHWSSLQASAVDQMCVGKSLYDNIQDKKLISINAIAFFCGCITGYLSNKIDYQDAIANLDIYIKKYPNIVADCKQKGLAAHPVSLYGSIESKLTPEEIKEFEKETKPLQTGLYKMRHVGTKASSENKSNETVPSFPKSEPQVGSKIKLGMSYAEIMKRIGGIKESKLTTSGDSLWIEYTDASLLMYQVPQGVCSLTFLKGKLSSCEGCNPQNFKCE